MSIVIKGESGFRAEQLLQPGMPEKAAEIIEGELIVHEPAGRYHNRIATEFLFLFREFCGDHPDLDYGNDNEGFLVQRNSDTLLSPDACLYRKRPAGDSVWMEFAPEVAVEVLSPSNSRAEIAYKRQKYFAAGCEQVWIADVRTQSVEFCFRDGVRIVAQGDELIQAQGIVGGLQFRLIDIFRNM